MHFFFLPGVLCIDVFSVWILFPAIPLSLSYTYWAFKYQLKSFFFFFQLKSWGGVFWTPWLSQSLFSHTLTKVFFFSPSDHFLTLWLKQLFDDCFVPPWTASSSRGRDHILFRSLLNLCLLVHLKFFNKHMLNESKGSTYIIVTLCFSPQNKW